MASLVGKIDFGKYHLNKYKITTVIISMKEDYIVFGEHTHMPRESENSLGVPEKASWRE